MMWGMQISPSPGVGRWEQSNDPEKLKRLAKEEWDAMERAAVAVRFIIYDPGGNAWQECSRYRGGSWRARWTWCDLPDPPFT